MGNETRVEIRSQFIKFVIVIASGVCAYFCPIASKYVLFNIQSEKILAGFDIAFFNTIFSILLALTKHALSKNRMKVRVVIKSSDQESGRLYLNNSMVDEEKMIDVAVNVDVSGKKRLCKKKLIIKCPDSYILQLEKRKNSSFIKEVITSERYELDLDEMLMNSPEQNLSFSREVHFSLLLEEHNQGNKDVIKFEKERSFGFITIDSVGLELIQK
ncbi:hypothetical protein [Vagococcus fluvialis]|uniref:hypothetical protein n=1 Tax=Vagococcus fluvialis TaxID=2738 RepID=UPI0037A745BA